MSPLFFLAELSGLTVLLCFLHYQRNRWGLVPLYVVFGLLEAFLFISGKGGEARTVVTLYGSIVSISTVLFLPLMLSTMVMVYILEGSRSARNLVAAVVCVYVIHGIVDIILFFHASHPPLGYTNLTNAALVEYDTWMRGASLFAVTLDLLCMGVIYQFVRNRLPWAPLAIPIWAAFIAAMATDAFAFAAINGTWVGRDGLRLLEKIQCGAAAGVPLSIYVSWYLRRPGIRIGEILDRDSLELLDLRAEVSQIRERLREQESAYRLIRDNFSRYVSPHVVEKLVADPDGLELGGEVRTLTILFVDIVGYSTISENIAPQRAIELINRYLDAVSKAILEEGGMINEIEGDGILAVFGAPLRSDDHADRAVRAGKQLLRNITALNRAFHSEGKLDIFHAAQMSGLSVRVGIHTGDAVVGVVGTQDRIKYAVIGDTVNTAARIEALCKELGTPLLFSGQTRRSLATEVEDEDLGTHQVKGKVQTVEIYRLRTAESAPVAAQ